MKMPERTRTVLAFVAVGVAAAVVASAGVWLLMSGAVDGANRREDEANRRATALESEVDSLAAQIASLESSLAAAETRTDETDTESGSGAGTGDDNDEASTAERQFCYVREVRNETGTTYVTVDYAQMLTGAEAADAAAAAGEESPPPNDYFIVNENPKLRTFPVRPGISVTLTTLADGVNPSGYTVLLGQWHDMFVGMSPGMERIRDVPYWITLENGTVTVIEEQYLP